MIVQLLLDDKDVVLGTEKLTLLLRNRLPNVQKSVYNLPYIWCPNKVLYNAMVKVIPDPIWKEVEEDHRLNGAQFMHVYRSKNLPNRHGYSNWCPKNSRFGFVSFQHALAHL